MSFLARIHVDRFDDLHLVIGDGDVNIDIVSMGDDHTAEVVFSGDDDELTLSLSRSLRRISDILSSAPVHEEV